MTTSITIEQIDEQTAAEISAMDEKLNLIRSQVINLIGEHQTYHGRAEDPLPFPVWKDIDLDMKPTRLSSADLLSALAQVKMALTSRIHTMSQEWMNDGDTETDEAQENANRLGRQKQTVQEYMQALIQSL